MNKTARICFALTACIALFLLVASIYDGRETWNVALYAIQFICSAGCLVADKLKKRKEKNGKSK